MCGYCNKYCLSIPAFSFGEEKIDFGILKEPITLRCFVCGTEGDWNLYVASNLESEKEIFFQIPIAYCPVCGQKLDDLYQQKKEG